MIANLRSTARQYRTARDIGRIGNDHIETAPAGRSVQSPQTMSPRASKPESGEIVPRDRAGGGRNIDARHPTNSAELCRSEQRMAPEPVPRSRIRQFVARKARRMVEHSLDQASRFRPRVKNTLGPILNRACQNSRWPRIRDTGSRRSRRAAKDGQGCGGRAKRIDRDRERDVAWSIPSAAQSSTRPSMVRGFDPAVAQNANELR